MSGIDIVNIVGGLGNQLFQYMFGRTLENISGRKMLFDISDFQHYQLHGGLAIEKYFEVELPLVSRAQLEQAPWICRSHLRKRISYHLASKGLPLLIQSDYTFDLRRPRAQLSNVEYFLGYWQSQAYLAGEVSLARNTLRFNEEIRHLADRAVDLVGINFKESAAIHLRRGDYVTSPARAPHYLLPLDYYLRAMDILVNEKGITKFYVFSDDINWAKLNFPAGYDLCFIDNSVSDSPGVDLCMMSKFSHIVISNSTFGWWAAAFRENESGLVLYPQQWVKPEFQNDLTKSTKPVDGWQALNGI
jgi:hypothetical protein